MRKLLAGALIGIVMVVAGLSLSGHASAVSGCDDYAIMKCGAETPTQFINKIQASAPDRNLKAIYADYGLVPSQYGRFVSSAKQGTVYDDGRIVVDGVVVGRSTQNVGRVHDANFNQKVTINGQDYWGGPFGSTYHANSADVMVMFNDRGVMQFAVVSSCGNPQRITPNAPNYSCDKLKRSKVDKNTYEFTTNATANQGAEVVKVVYNFGDGDSKTVVNLAQPVRHTFSKNSTVRATVYVRVPGGNVVTTTSVDCAVDIAFATPPTPPKPPKPTLPLATNATCTSLQAELIDQATHTYKFTATAQYQNTTFTGGSFSFGDGATMDNLLPNGNQVTVQHTYAAAGSYTAVAVLSFTDAAGKVGGANCTVAISPAPNAVTTAVTTPTCESEGKGDCELTDTGPGTIIAGIFGGATAVAAGTHFVIRRRLLGL